MRIWGLAGLVIIALAVFVVILANQQVPAAVSGEASTLLFEANGPSRWYQLLHAGAVLQGRTRMCYPHTRGLEGWSVRGDRLEVRVAPGVSPVWVANEATRRGVIELVEGGTEFLPIGKRVITGDVARPELNVYEVVLAAPHFVAVEAHWRYNRPVIEFRLTPEGDVRLRAHTKEQSGYYLCLLVDGQVVNCPILRTPLVDRSGVMELTGSATLAQAHMWAALLHSGPLPVTLRTVEMRAATATESGSRCGFETAGMH